MKHVQVMHVSALRVGDVVRPIGGGGEPGPYPRIRYTLADGTEREVSSTAGWRHSPIGGPDDFRQGYDAMTVTRVDDDYVDFIRPYLHLNPDGSLSTVGFEHVDHCNRTHGGHWYELLSTRRDHGPQS